MGLPLGRPLIDVAIRIGSLEDSTLHAKALGRSPLSVVASPDYLTRRGGCDSPDALKDHDIIGFTAPESLNFWHLAEGVKVQPTLRAFPVHDRCGYRAG